MRGRRGADTDSSLELLLDTICNTFGGVLFIAILLALSVRPEPTAETTADPAESLAAAKAETMLAELAELEDLLSQQAALAEALKADEVTAADASLAMDESQVEQTTAAAEAAAEAKAEAEAETAKTREELAALDQSLSEAKRKRDKAKEDLEKAYKDREQSVSMPKLGGRGGIVEVAAVLQYNRLYIWHRFAGPLVRGGLNTSDFYVAEETSEGAVCKPIPTAGVDLTGPGAVRRVRARLDEFSPRFNTVVLVVRADSFGTYRVVRDAVKAEGFKFRLYAGSSPVYDRGGSGERSQ